jgi:ATP-dependent DNA helicase RecG
MTATPIPRTLSMTLYGDLDLSVIDELPAGRKPIKTMHLFDSQRGKLYQFFKDEIKKGRQIYIVYPLIKESETLDYKNLQEGYEQITKIFREPDFKVGMVHGQMKPIEKQAQMDNFVAGKTNILVATTVIEVGVNVPNASVMVIESSEKFGLSQLHQLRGRVGRSAEQSYCILMTGQKLNEDARKRLSTMVKTNDGFEIAEVDLRLRGPGDMFGTQQSGSPINFKIANILTDVKILQVARQKASEILTDDPFLKKEENKNLNVQVQKTLRQSWGLVS